MTSKISKNVIDKIKREKIKPKSRWSFLAKNYAFWILAMVMILMGAIAFSIIVFVIFDLDWDLYKYNKINPIFFFLRTIPFLWIILFGLFTYLSYLIFRKTKKGYRYHYLYFSLFIALLSLIFGVFLYFSGFNEFLERTMLHKLPFCPNRIAQWSNPQKGFLAGEVISINDDNIEIIDLENKPWKVILPQKKNFLSDKYKNGNLRERKKNKIEGLRVKIIGEKVDNNTFKATDLRPWFHRPPFQSKQEYFRPMKHQMKQNQLPVK